MGTTFLSTGAQEIQLVIFGSSFSTIIRAYRSRCAT